MDEKKGTTTGKAREVFSGGDYAVMEGKIRVRFRPYETKAFLFVNDHVVFGLERERREGDAYEDVEGRVCRKNK